MKIKCLFTLCGVLLSSTAFSSNVGVVDSGTWFTHKYFANHVWINANDFPNNGIDDDRNDKIDDYNGWNFAANNNKVFAPEYISSINTNIYKMFEIISKIELGTITEEENQWWQDNVRSLPQDQKNQLIDHLNWYGTYAHGTHTAGIVAQGNPTAKIMSAKIFPDNTPALYPYTVSKAFEVIEQNKHEGITHWLAAYASNQMFSKVALYLNENKVDAANYSIGVPMGALAEKYLKLKNPSPTPEQIQAEALLFYDAFESFGKAWIKSAPNTLFVVAAGNEGLNNEIMPVFPANIEAENAITVAATQSRSKLAEFSNWGPVKVQIAAPGVAINSSVPGGSTSQFLPMSGTSMAAPYVTMVASKIKDANQALTGAQLKKILLETVDKKAWLEGKVSSSGVVNDERAIACAILAKSMSLDSAIARARETVADLPETMQVVNANSAQPTQEMLDFARMIRK